ncbi:DUF2934 domain-containing protein [Caballeronia sp.]|uniref:DUF2934 domain-containing protein n=1 Tax=Caballeronia sp. TaxID=1931223 RepID=UPI003C45EC39
MANKTLDEQIRLHAYYLWEADGCPEGRAHDYWQKARTLLEKQHAASAAPIDETRAVELMVEKAAKKPAKSKTAATTPGKKGVKVTKTDGKDAAKPSKETSAKAAGKPKSVAKANDKPAKKKAAGKSAAEKPATKTVAAKPAARATAKSKSIDKA